MSIRVTPLSALTTNSVSVYRFLFELHAPIEQLLLHGVKKEADALEVDELMSAHLDAAVGHLVVIVNSFERINRLDAIDLLSPATQAFFASAKALGVYGQDSALADLRIESIKRNEDAPYAL